jgi:rubrerythrin
MRKTHEKKQPVSATTVFVETQRYSGSSRWRCTECHYAFRSAAAPVKCPRCYRTVNHVTPLAPSSQ